MAIERDYVIDAGAGCVERYSTSLQAYTESAFRDLLAECGYKMVEFFPSLHGGEDPEQTDLCVISARKTAA